MTKCELYSAIAGVDPPSKGGAGEVNYIVSPPSKGGVGEVKCLRKTKNLFHITII